MADMSRTELSGEVRPDFMQLLRSPTATYDEGVRFFGGTGLMNDAAKQLATDLDRLGIPYGVIGAVALNLHGYQRFTVDIDILLTQQGLEIFQSELVGRGYRPAFEGARKKFRSTAENVPIEIITSGEYPGDGKPKPVRFPTPPEDTIVIDGIRTVTLEKLIELKIASGTTGLARRKDLADVQELIRVLALEAALADSLDPSVRDVYLELHAEVAAAREQAESPDTDG
jgi:hypothetical protein